MKDGVQIEVIQQLKKAIGFDEMEESKKHFALSMDEMKIRSGLVFKRETGELTGFCNLGGVNQDLERLQVKSVLALRVLSAHRLCGTLVWSRE